MFVLDALEKYAHDRDRAALVTAGQALSYFELNRRSDAFAAYLLEKFPPDKTPVVISGHKEEAFLCCMYGALKAGCAYIPIDITLPLDRAEQIIEDVSPRVIVDFNHSTLGEKSCAVRLDTAAVEAIFEQYGDRKPDRESRVGKNDTCYILFTSGSTGKPKGVPISRKNLENLSDCFTKWCDTGEEDQVFTNQISYSFDVSVVSVYIGVSLGKTLFTFEKNVVENMKLLMEQLSLSDTSFWVSTPSFAELCVTSALFHEQLLPKLKTFCFCGEVLTHKLVDTLKTRFPSCRIINTYGPTEATVLVTASEITKEMSESELSIPIGKPLDEVELRIVNEQGETLSEGEKGELLIISDNVSEGYFHRPDLTEKVFFETISKGVKKRGYRTGDKCFLKDGEYYYCGRLDYQIKLNGYRIELEDVENNLTKVENISRAIAIPVFEGEKVAYIAAFVLLKEPEPSSPLKQMIAIKEKAKEFLPFYMIPRKIIVKDSFPVNTNGKVDRKLLAKEL